MRMRAAVLEEFGQPLRGAGGRAGRAARGRGARAPAGLRGVPHRHVHGLGRRPVGLRAHRARPRGRGRGGEGGAGRVAGARGRPRGHAVLAPVRRVRALHQPAHQPVHGHPRRAEPGPPARRHGAAVPRRRGDPPLHGHLHVRGVHGDARDRAGRGLAPTRRPTTRACSPAACPPAWARRSTPRAWSPAPPRWCSAPGWWAWARGRRPAPGGGADRVRGPVRGAAGDGARPGRHRHLRGRSRQRGARAGDDRRHGRRLHVRGHRQRGR